MRERVVRLEDTEEQEICCRILSPRDVRSYVHNDCPNYELNKDTINRNDTTNKNAKVDREKLKNSQSYTENYKQLRNSESGRNHLPQGRAHQLIIQ